MGERESGDKQTKLETNADSPSNGGSGENVIGNVGLPSNAETAQTTAPHPAQQEEASYWSKVAEAVIDWLRRYWEKPREKSKRTDIATVVLTTLIAAAAIWSAWIFQGQLNEARHQTEVSQRPWLASDGKATYSVQAWKDDRATLSFSFNVKNFGSSPALNVGYGVYPFTRRLPDKLPLFEDEKKHACELADGMVRVSSEAIFPGQAMHYGVQGGFLVPGAKSSVPYVLFYACLAYTDQFDPTRITHHTTFCLWGPVKAPYSLSLCGVNDTAN